MKKKIILPIIAVAIFFTTTSYKSDFFEIAKQIEIFTTLFKEINMNYVDETNPAELMDTAITAMLAELDPYTVYWNEQEVEQARIQNSGEYTGIGASVQTRDHKITIVEPYKGYPADKAGLKAGDEIIQIGEVNVSDFNDDAGELLKGAPGTSVQLKYRRQGKIETTELKREAVELNAVPFFKLFNNDIGYIVLSKFNRKASSEVASALKKLKEQGAKKIILDLRGNPGGLLTEAVNTTNIFVNKGEVITTTKSIIEKYNQSYKTQKDPLDIDIPLAVLVNGRSASASEIVSGSLQDLDRAVVIGARSFGKGLVQRPKPLTYNTQLKVTISRYYTPSGRCIQALDYWNRDKDGNAVRTKAEDYNEFTTRNGRKVYDGGGILPDVLLETSKFSGVTQALVEKNAIFDYATHYYFSHKLTNVKDFNFTDKDYQDFKTFLKSTDFDYTTKTEKELKNTLKIAQKEGFSDDINTQYQQLLNSINKAKEKDLEDKKPEIVNLLTDEIIKRYFYQEGLYNFYIEENPEILKAVEILNNSKEYNRILGKL
ncbi:carboxyl-terminal processing protease [Mesonia phycicola]|uniref:Carboxyl-terminal processing protease n=1 Tax=Mesonia phycicola TaxID=579105 RepID=A0A1M6D5C2_9FLAO|nr:S41 family peptidase [Mesonia phycicola]SHI68410.1 carboxyl-terminal processing protease [Mesonia phycicola]